MTPMANRDLSNAEWRDKAEAYCARAEHCADDVRRKLYEWQAPAELTESILQHLYDCDFINDERFCRAYVHDKVEYQAWGRMKIQAGLRALHLPENAIRNALDNINEERYRENLQSLIRQRSAPTSPLPPTTIRFLLQRGFTYEEIHP